MLIHLYRHALPLMLTTLVIGLVLGSALAERETKTVVYEPNLFSSLGKAEPNINENYTVRVNLPAVSSENSTGVTAYLQAKAVEGTGKIFINLENVLLAADTQQSTRIAALVASNYTQKRIDTIDIYYDLTADATILEGPSAGAAFTIATIALLEQKKVRQDVMITGTINHDGTVGPAGKILEKAHASKEKDASLFLVPLGLSTEVNYTESEFCYTWGSKEFCTPELHPKVLNISQEANIPVFEVKTIEDAAQYFFEEN